MIDKIVRDIKSLKIQGASNIAWTGLHALDYVARTSKAKSKKEFLNELRAAKNKLFDARPTEPMLRNAVRYVLFKAKETDEFNYRKETRDYIKSLYGSAIKAKKRVIDIGKNVVKKNYTVLTHCHSSTVAGILKKAKPKKVICTETRPLFQGRITAKELVSADINTTMIIDSAVADFIKEADIVLLGCDVIAPNYVVNKIGSKCIGLLCEKYDIPLYICSTSFKFDPESRYGVGVKIEERSPKEVWNKPPKNLKILNPAFDIIDYDNITGFINELGVFSPDSLFVTLREKYKWMFEP